MITGGEEKETSQKDPGFCLSNWGETDALTEPGATKKQIC